MRVLRGSALIGLLVLAFAAAAPAGAERSPAPSRARACADVKPMLTRTYAYAAYVKRSARAYRRPGRGLIARFERRNRNGADQVFGVLGAVRNRSCKAVWYRVQLPARPNGVVGYVRPWAVILRIVRTRIVVDLSDRRVLLYRRGRLAMSGRAAIGTSATPTPLGRFYVNQRLIPTNPYGPFGVGAIGISAFSNVLTGWTQGGPVAIHGTNQPHLLGRQVSNGCIRIHNAVMRRMFRLAYSGTPVTIRR
jgi:lipoprotein-anchoring transpeptidase ErfK/SrfK